MSDDLLLNLHRTALRLLARREHTRVELQRKLMQKCPDASSTEIKTVLDALAAENSLSEERFTGAYIRMRVARGFGPLRILSELNERGIAAECATPHFAEIDWIDCAVLTREKRFGKTLPMDLTERSQQMRFLEYKGFSHEQIRLLFK